MEPAKNKTAETKVPLDDGMRLNCTGEIIHKIPLIGQLPKPEERLYFNKNCEKPERKKKQLKLSFGQLTRQNVE